MFTRQALFIAALGLGVAGCKKADFSETPVEHLPVAASAMPVIWVSATYPGADSVKVADAVAVPLETQINGIDGIVRIESESRSNGSYSARVVFEPNTDPNQALTLVQNRIGMALASLPDQARKSELTAKISAPIQNDTIVAIALQDRDGSGREALEKWSAAVLKRLETDGASKPTSFPGPDQTLPSMKVNRDRCAKLEVSPTDVVIATEAAGDTGIEKVKALTVKSKSGAQVKLESVLDFTESASPSTVYRLNLYPAVYISGPLPEGKTVAQATARWVELAEVEMPKGFAVEAISKK